MSHKNYDPARVAGSPLFHPDECCCAICGPGGTSTHTENDEKGILETNLAKVISGHVYAALGSNHDSHKQGIYTTNSIGDND